jgi:hypothetical protein
VSRQTSLVAEVPNRYFGSRVTSRAELNEIAQYFTKGLLVWSPPIAILSWVFFQLQGKTKMIEISLVRTNSL